MIRGRDKATTACVEMLNDYSAFQAILLACILFEEILDKLGVKTDGVYVLLSACFAVCHGVFFNTATIRHQS